MASASGSGGVLDELARLGPLFALDQHPAASLPAAPWRPLDELFEHSGALAERVKGVRAALAAASGQDASDVAPRVAASMVQLGLTGRLVCPAVAVAAITGEVVGLDPGRMRWQPAPDGAIPLSVVEDVLPDGTARRPSDPDALAGALAASLLLAGPVAALIEASRPFGVSARVLWGNVASVVHGVPVLIAAVDPHLAMRTETLTTRLLHQPPLAGTHQEHPVSNFRRRSCCLVYQLAPSRAPVCGDCVLHQAPGRRPRC
jgi:ferric iron reductase protein FhuF